MMNKKEADRQWYKKNKKSHLKRTSAWKKTNNQKSREYAKKQHARDRADWEEVFDRMFEERGFKQCFICGNPLFQCHHLTPALKSFKTSEMKKVKLTEERVERLRQELLKCFPLCVVCHKIIHWEMKKESPGVSL